MDTVSRGKERTYMKTFTIDTDNNISVFATEEEAAAASTTPFDSFASRTELEEVAGNWPAERLVEIWNSVPGVTPVERFKDRKTGIGRIWKQIEGLGGSPEPKTEQQQAANPEQKAARR